MDETAWVELRTLSEKEMIPAIHYNLLASILRRLDKIEAATAYARPQWEMTGTGATAPALSASSAPTIGESGTAEPPSESSTDRVESAPTVKVEEIGGRYRLTVQTGVATKSILCTWEELAAIRNFCFSPWSISESQTPSSGITPAGNPGPAAPGDCPACRVVHFRLHLDPPILGATTGGVR